MKTNDSWELTFARKVACIIAQHVQKKIDAMIYESITPKPIIQPLYSDTDSHFIKINWMDYKE